jgi:hypothetical protein
MDSKAYTLEITDLHGVRVESYRSSDDAKRAADVLLQSGAQSVTFLIFGSAMWTRFAKKG